MVKSFRKHTLPLAALFAVSLAACGGSSTTPEEEAAAKLDAAYASYGSGNLPEAMSNLDDSIAAEATPDALLMKAQLQWQRGDVEASQATIAAYKVAYPASGTRLLGGKAEVTTARRTPGPMCDTSPRPRPRRRGVVSCLRPEGALARNPGTTMLRACR